MSSKKHRPLLARNAIRLRRSVTPKGGQIGSSPHLARLKPCPPRHSPFLIVLSSPSGAGKTTICREVVKRDKNVGYSVSATTRPKRLGEVDGRDYFFYTLSEFNKKKNKGEFIETAKVYGNFYGTPKSEVRRILGEGKDVIMDLDIQGMKSIKRIFPDSVSIFITPSNRRELKTRLAMRNEAKTEILRRTNYQKKELAAMPKFDYFVANDDLKTAVSDILTIIRAERLKTHRQLKTKKFLNQGGSDDEIYCD
uniref:Guanylate kinase n=1 Tax=candidate division WOR-3 bacterium TaxID=2052148 RepID=A0A7C6A9L8_UNCW3